eukprot:5245690-Amphidinium_carterae.1
MAIAHAGREDLTSIRDHQTTPEKQRADEGYPVVHFLSPLLVFAGDKLGLITGRPVSNLSEVSAAQPMSCAMHVTTRC